MCMKVGNGQLIAQLRPYSWTFPSLFWKIIALLSCDSQGFQLKNELVFAMKGGFCAKLHFTEGYYAPRFSINHRTIQRKREELLWQQFSDILGGQPT